MTDYVEVGDLRVARSLYDLVKDEIAPGTDVDPDGFWSSFSDVIGELGPRNFALLDKRDAFQTKIDTWLRARRQAPIEASEFRAFLQKINYILPEGDAFKVTTSNVDSEIAAVAGPQLVVPVDNARYALNAANARWGSLYDALYGTDVIPEDEGAEKGASYNPARGMGIVERAKVFLDEAIGLADGRFREITEYALADAEGSKCLVVTLEDGRQTGLADPSKLAGYVATDGTLSRVLLRNNGLHIEIQLDREHPIGKSDQAGVKDVLLEAAVTTIEDCEDSVSAVDAEDKTRVYRNWLGLMKGTLEATLEKSGREITRTLHPDRIYTAPEVGELRLPGRSLMLVRNVGMHMYTDAVTSADGEAVPEGFLDAMVTSLCAKHDLVGTARYTNSRAGSIYIVKPKLHSPEEVAATVTLFGRVEDALGLARNTIKMGIMDEERRLTVNLKEAIRAASERIIFINTGFLDRTGDEIHTLMEAGPVIPKMEMKGAPWILAYEDWNVDIGLACGLRGKAQIGKGMWPMPDAMRAMVETKMAHPLAGANTAWVPSPTAATLHALHYHQINVADRQAELERRERASLDAINTLPLLGGRNLSEEEVRNELDNNAQSILGYVVRWVDQGIGCSKVPDIHDVPLMEDRATLRISSQHIANWLFCGILTEEEVREAFERMAAVVDQQNAGDPNYHEMATDFHNSIAFQAALDLVLKGRVTANGYTEPVLHTRRREVKAKRG